MQFTRRRQRVLCGCQKGRYHNCLFSNVTGFPLGLENLEKWEGIFQSGKSQGILYGLKKSGKSHKILEKSGNIRIMLVIIFSDIQMNRELFAKLYHVLSLTNKTLKHTEKWKKSKFWLKFELQGAV